MVASKRPRIDPAVEGRNLDRANCRYPLLRHEYEVDVERLIPVELVVVGGWFATETCCLKFVVRRDVAEFVQASGDAAAAVCFTAGSQVEVARKQAWS